jgi:aryl-alcohol dehydrogenase-like predicted oxidoreductase
MENFQFESASSLAWVLRRPEIASAIIGASRLEQIADDMPAVGAKFPTEVLKQINGAVGGAAVWE